MTILTASSVSLRELATIFNQAFSDYMIEVYFTEPSLEEYVRRHGLDLETSLVAEADGLMVGLLLCGRPEARAFRRPWLPGHEGKSLCYLGQMLFEPFDEFTLAQPVTTRDLEVSRQFDQLGPLQLSQVHTFHDIFSPSLSETGKRPPHGDE